MIDERFRQEWADRFGFLAEKHPRDSIESIDEVACILGGSVEAAALMKYLADVLRNLQATHAKHYMEAKWEDADDDAQAEADHALEWYEEVRKNAP